MLCSTQRCITAHYITATPHLKTPLPKTRRGPSCQQTVGSNQAPHHCLEHGNINLNSIRDLDASGAILQRLQYVAILFSVQES